MAKVPSSTGGLPDGPEPLRAEESCLAAISRASLGAHAGDAALERRPRARACVRVNRDGSHRLTKRGDRILEMLRAMPQRTMSCRSLARGVSCGAVKAGRHGLLRCRGRGRKPRHMRQRSAQFRGVGAAAAGATDIGATPAEPSTRAADPAPTDPAPADPAPADPCACAG
jgi:hypothetical protein